MRRPISGRETGASIDIFARPRIYAAACVAIQTIFFAAIADQNGHSLSQKIASYWRKHDKYHI
jgi:hypothetical protein